jgi:hypothetical protein
MAKEPHQKTNAELAQDLSTRPDSLIHLTAKAEMARRAAVQDQWRSWIMFASVVIAALAAAASACSAYFAYLSSLHKWERQNAPREKVVHRRLSSLHLILERHAFRVILLKPCLGGFLARKDL